MLLNLMKTSKNKIQNEIFNVGHQNLSILQIAKKVKKIVEKKFGYKKIKIEVQKSQDNRSYHINSSKFIEN